MVSKPKQTIKCAEDIIAELERIATTVYKEKDHSRNHQTFALALMYIIYKLRYPKICKDLGF